MQALNHVIAGSIIGITLANPLIALPLALTSHFAMDAVPHYGEDDKAPRGSKPYLARILIDGVVSVFFVTLIIGLKPSRAALIMLCAFMAVLPDLLWPLAYIVPHDKKLWSFFVFHKRIQHENRAWWKIELIWLLVSIIVIIYFVPR